MNEPEKAIDPMLPPDAPRETEAACDVRAETPSSRSAADTRIVACEELIHRVRRHTPDCLSDLAGQATSAWGQHELAQSATVAQPARLGRFEIEDLIGQGGYAIVYRAHDPKLGRDVAVKVPRLATLATEVDRLRFVQEAKTLSALDHPQIATMFEAGCDGPVSFAVSELCTGGTLASLIESNGSLSPRMAAYIVQRLAQAVHHAHSRGVIHRDLKPSNILFSEPVTAATDPGELVDCLRVSDFGLAKFVDADAQLTHSVAYLGTPAYMSPEQADGDPTRIGTYSDIYSLGAILYELLTGRPPFHGPSTLAILDDVRHRNPTAVRTVSPGVPRDLESICLKCLEKDAQRRYETAASLADDLGAFLKGSPVQARRVSLMRRAWQYAKQHRAAAAFFVTLVVLAVAGPAAAVWINAERLQTQAHQRVAERQRSRAVQAERRSRERLDQAIAAIDEMVTQLHLLEWAPESQKARRTLLARVDRLTKELASSNDDARIDALRRRVLVQLAKFDAEHGAADSAREFSRQAVDAARRLVARFPEDRQYRIGLADALHALAMTEYQNGGVDNAIRVGRQALKAYRNVERPKRVVQAALWRSYGDLAAWLMARRSFREAESTARDGLQQCAPEGTAPSSDAGRLEAFAYLSYRLGESLTRQKRHEEAFKHLDTAGSIWTRLWKSDELDTGLYIRRAGDCGRELARNPVVDDFPQWFAEALGELERYCKNHPTDARIAQSFASLSNQLGLRSRARGEFLAAETHHRRALDVYTRLVAGPASSVRCRRELGGAWNNLALAQIKLKRPADAWDSIQRAISGQQRLLQEHPDDAIVRRYLANHFTVATQIQLLLGDPLQAAQFAQAGGELLARSKMHQLGTAHALCLCATVAGKSTRDEAEDTAERIRDRAVAVLSRAVAEGLVDPAALANDSRFDSLADHPTFRQLVE